MPGVLEPIAVAQAPALELAHLLLKDLDEFLSGAKLDVKHVTVAVLAAATPCGLAEFAQQGSEEEPFTGGRWPDEVAIAGEDLAEANESANAAPLPAVTRLRLVA